MNHKPFFLLCVACMSALHANSQILDAGDVKMTFSQTKEGYTTSLTYRGADIPFFVTGCPATIDVTRRTRSALYSSVQAADSGYICQATVVSTRGSEFLVTDRYLVWGDGQIELRRQVKVTKVVAGDNYFCSKFELQTTSNEKLTDNDYLVPGVLYKGYFDAACNTPEGLPNAKDAWFLYRNDRTPLPFVMSRCTSTGVTINLAHKDSKNRTVVADCNSTAYNADYQFGSVGLFRDTTNKITYQAVYYPGTTESTKQGKGLRYHPVNTSVQHAYNVFLRISTTSSYAEAVRQSWNQVFDLYNPPVYTINQDTCYLGLINSLLQYYVPSRTDGGQYDAPGWPFEVSLTDFLPKGIDYQMGFVGMQVSSGYYVYRYGIENKSKNIQHKGEAVLDFWADKCLTRVGMPNTWYDPRTSGSGSWRNYESILRIMTGGMEGLLSAWCFGTKNGDQHANWLTSCKKFGDWLVSEQKENGAFPFSWNNTRLQNDRHPVKDDNALTTPSALRYLVELYIATSDEKYKTAALKAGEYCLLFVHKKYHYCAGVVDNPRVIDSESGYLAMQGFLSLYDLTRDTKWLEAAQQAATYTETWVYSYEVPVEDDRVDDNPIFPRDRSVIGQHLIAIGHSAADLGFAWCSFAYYHLYLLTGDAHYLKMARLSAHNTKQSMNWDGSLYPGQARGLQLEAFQVMIPRRVGGVATTLNWNYAGNLDPMYRMMDAFGTIDIENVEKMDPDVRMQKLQRYMLYQSSDYGQFISGIEKTVAAPIVCYPNPVGHNAVLNIPVGDQRAKVMLFTLNGLPLDTIMGSGLLTMQMSYPQGNYLLTIQNNDGCETYKIVIQ